MMQTPKQPDATGPKKRQHPVIAIDGPAGAGKSTLAAHLARRFGFLNLETGAMYRALALKAIENDYAFDEEAPLMDLAGRTRITLEPQVEGNRVLLDAIDVSRRIREADVTSAASKISIHPHLRAWMVQQQRLAEEAVIRELKERDYRDRHRAESPLQPAQDAVILDSTSMTLDEVLAHAEEIVRSHLPCEAS